MRIETDRLILRRWNAGDAQPLLEILNQPEVAAWLGSQTPEDVDGMLERYAYSWDTLGYGRFAVEDASTGELVGRVGLMWQKAWTATPDKAEVGWAIAPGRWGEGLATEAARASIADAFTRVGLDRIVSFALPSNVASLKVMENCGLTFGGHAEWAGRDHVWMSLDAEHHSDL